MKFSVDVLDWFGAGGWAFAPGARVVIEVWSEGACIARSVPDRLRQDVAALFPDTKESRVSGFRAAYSLPTDASVLEVSVTGVEIDHEGNASGERRELARKNVRNPSHLISAIADATTTDLIAGPFPRGIEAVVRKLWPDTPPGHDENAQRQIVDKLKSLAPQLSGASSPVPLILSYFRFIRATWSHFQFVNRYFPSVNPGKTVTDTDWRCRPNSPAELFSIAHHLYVLKSYGVVGDFAEFGCYKGFSSSMLSYACAYLGVKMHIFDSFAGLPASDSTIYKQGEFRGSINEVKQNLSTFGTPAAVQYHEGFFSESVPRDAPALNGLMTIWMDVDLFDSATDVMPMVDKMDRRGAVFSHECAVGHFDNGGIKAPQVGNDVVSAIVNRFNHTDDALTGRHLTGSTGAFWTRPTGIPVLANACLIDLANAI